MRWIRYASCNANKIAPGAPSLLQLEAEDEATAQDEAEAEAEDDATNQDEAEDEATEQEAEEVEAAAQRESGESEARRGDGRRRWLSRRRRTEGSSASGRVPVNLRAIHEAHLPTCEDMGKTAAGFQYLGMQMAGPTMIKHIRSGQFSVPQQKSFFAQLVASIYGLHAVNIGHDDLNSGNIIFDGDRLSFVDFGLSKTLNHLDSRNVKGYSRDGNALFRYAALFAGCPGDAQWVSKWWRQADLKAQKAHQDRALRCFKEKWGADEELLDSLRNVFELNVKESRKQGIAAVFHTKFVQQNLPKLSGRYGLEGTEGCEAWPVHKLKTTMRQQGAKQPPR